MHADRTVQIFNNNNVPRRLNKISDDEKAVAKDQFSTVIALSLAIHKLFGALIAFWINSMHLAAAKHARPCQVANPLPKPKNALHSFFKTNGFGKDFVKDKIEKHDLAHYSS